MISVDTKAASAAVSSTRMDAGKKTDAEPKPAPKAHTPSVSITSPATAAFSMFSSMLFSVAPSAGGESNSAAQVAQSDADGDEAAGSAANDHDADDAVASTPQPTFGAGGTYGFGGATAA